MTYSTLSPLSLISSRLLPLDRRTLHQTMLVLSANRSNISSDFQLVKSTGTLFTFPNSLPPSIARTLTKTHFFITIILYFLYNSLSKSSMLDFPFELTAPPQFSTRGISRHLVSHFPIGGNGLARKAIF